MIDSLVKQVSELYPDLDMLEIGAGFGDNTIYLLKAVSKNGRTVIVIDPFGKNTNAPDSYVLPYPKEKFLDNTKEYSKYLYLIEESSQDLDRIDYKLSFAFVDGLQTEGAVEHDLELVKNAKVICVDDYNRTTGICIVKPYVDNFVKKYNKELIIKDRYAIIHDKQDNFKL